MANIKIFEDRKVRVSWDAENEDWWFSLVDVVEILTDSIDPSQYLKRLRSRDKELNSYIGTNCTHVDMIEIALKPALFRWSRSKNRHFFENQGPKNGIFCRKQVKNRSFLLI